MHVEVSVALNFVISYLYNKLPRRRVDSFGEELERGLKKKFEGHWYPDRPYKGSGFRCIRVSGEKIDPTIASSAQNSGLDIDEIKEYLPKDLTVWIDPHEVSYRIGEKGVAKILYSDRHREAGGDTADVLDTADREVQIANKSFNPEAQCFKPIDSLSSSLTNLSLSPSPHGWGSSSHSASVSPGSVTPTGGAPTPTAAAAAAPSTSPVASYHGRQAAAPTMTAAMFAQTKFGSTKLKTQGKRPSRLSPTELGSYLKQRGGGGVGFPPPAMPPPQPGSWPSTPVTGPVVNPFLGASRGQQGRALSPRDMRQEYYLEQQQRLLLLQQATHLSQLSQSTLMAHAQNPLLSHQPQLPQPQLPLAAQQPPLYNGGLLSPVSGPEPSPDSPGHHGGYHVGQAALPGPGSALSSSASSSASSGDGGAQLQDPLNWNCLPPYVGLQHLLVAN